MAISDTTIISDPEIYPGRTDRIRSRINFGYHQRQKERKSKSQYSTAQKGFLLNEKMSTQLLVISKQFYRLEGEKKNNTLREQKAKYHRKLKIK